MWDIFISRSVIILVSMVLIVKVFSLYSPYSSDKMYLDFINQIRFIRNLVYQDSLLQIENTLRDLSIIFKVVSIERHDNRKSIKLLSAYNTQIVIYVDEVVYSKVNTCSENSFVPLKTIVDVDSFLDDGVPSTGCIVSEDGKYYPGCRIIIKNR
ncbi:MAG: hypothetical protein ABDH21_04580 [bacterium]